MIDPHILVRAIDGFLAEDIASGDLTSTLLLEPGSEGRFVLAARSPIVVAGVAVALAVFDRYDATIRSTALVADGARVGPGTALARIAGPARSILTAERVALNLVQRMSAVATDTAAYVAAIAGTRAVLVDTRKTTPGLRAFEKYAVTCGGGRNHRRDLAGGVLVKDNHIAVCGGIAAAVARARAGAPLLTKIEVECDTLAQVEEAVAAAADMLLLDNMDPPTLARAVALVAGRVPLEASGGVRLDTIRAIAETGVDFISVGRITQWPAAVDIGLDEDAGD
jgi:nicotinate-nucleotide pyrophosphorylase (carboxylating)